MVAQQQRACVRGKTERQVDQNDGRFRTTGRIPKDAAAFAAVSEYMVFFNESSLSKKLNLHLTPL
jgi:hypothetical protein